LCITWLNWKIGFGLTKDQVTNILIHCQFLGFCQCCQR
jgi:hypothetical protein